LSAARARPGADGGRARGGDDDGMNGPARFRVLVAGGGVAGLEALLALRELAAEHVDLTLIEPRQAFHLHALRPAEPFGAGRAGCLPVADIAGMANARLVRDVVRSVNTDAHVVRTALGAQLPYDALLIAVGARPVVAIPAGLTWWPAGDHAQWAHLLGDAESRSVRRIAFVVPSRCAWELPAYELALMTARHLRRRGRAQVDLMLISPERAPLAQFGATASAAVSQELSDAGVRFHGSAIAMVRAGTPLSITTRPAPLHVDVDRVVALPRAFGPELAGLRADIEGFLVADEHCRVRRTPDVWAVGDATTRLPKQGGLATLQADCAAEDIAALAGAPVLPRPYRPVLRAQLLTGRGPLWLQRDLADEADPGEVSALPLWSPPGKIAARRLGAVLAARDRRSTAYARPVG
jgi:sulfide:quinone oxidoreductase